LISFLPSLISFLGSLPSFLDILPSFLDILPYFLSYLPSRYQVSGVEPSIMGIGPVPAMQVFLTVLIFSTEIVLTD
jgi:hypothetical protein